jgi:hypothetical protein
MSVSYRHTWTTILACTALAATTACSDSLLIGDDIVWSADQESGDLSQWLSMSRGGTVFNPGDASTPTLDTNTEAPDSDISVDVTSEVSHSGSYALKLNNPGNRDLREIGMEIFRVVGPVDDAFYSAWFMLPLEFDIQSALTIARLRSRNSDGALFNGEELQLRSLPTGGYVLQVFHNNSAFLREPLPEVPPRFEAGTWVHIEARYQPNLARRLRVWLNGILAYDLSGRPDATGDDLVFSICSTGERFAPEPLVLFVDDVAVSLSRVGVRGQLRADPEP